MTRMKALHLIATQLDFLNGKFNGVRDDFSFGELKKADVILTTLEQAGMLPPKFQINDGGFITKQELKDVYEIDGDFDWEPKSE